MIPITVPNLGFPPSESMHVSSWMVTTGEEVVEGDRLVELLIGEVTFDVASPATGRFLRRAVELDSVVHPGDLLGAIEPAD